MNRLLLTGLAAGGALAVAVPTAMALASAPSFSQRVPVRVPSGAASVSYDDHGTAVELRHTATGTPTRTAAPPPTTVPSVVDDHGGDRTRTGTRSAEPGDDHGGDRSREVEPGDDHGGDRTRTGTRSAEPGDDHGDDHGDDSSSTDGGHHGDDSGDDSGRDDSGADDGSGHGGAGGSGHGGDD